MTEAEGFSIWLMPKGPKKKEFSNIISKLAKKYKGPVFEPHITLLGEIKRDKEDVLNRANQLAQVVKPFTVKLDSVGYGKEYFRCVYAKAVEEYEFMKAADIARRFFYMESDEFMPHLSLLYGDIKEDVKRKVASGLEVDDQIEINTLFVVETNGKPKDWKIIKEIKFR